MSEKRNWIGKIIVNIDDVVVLEHDPELDRELEVELELVRDLALDPVHEHEELEIIVVIEIVEWGDDVVHEPLDEVDPDHDDVVVPEEVAEAEAVHDH